MEDNKPKSYITPILGDQVPDDETPKKNKGGRSKEVKVTKVHEIDELIERVKKVLDSPDDLEPLTKEQLIKEVYKQLTRFMLILTQDARTIDPKNTVTAKTNNGKTRFNPVGLPKEDREHVRASITILKDLLATLTLNEEAMEGNEDRIASRLLKHIPSPLEGFKNGKTDPN